MIYIILVGLGGGLGALARYSTGVYIQDKIESKMPLHTLFINVLGSFLLAYVYSHFNNKGLLTFMATGFLGGFTTFSTFIVENLNLALDGHITISLLYVALSIFLSIGACFLGVLI